MTLITLEGFMAARKRMSADESFSRGDGMGANLILYLGMKRSEIMAVSFETKKLHSGLGMRQGKSAG
jgi:hypothetical protein